MRKTTSDRKTTKMIITLSLCVEDSEIEKRIYNSIEESQIKVLTDLISYTTIEKVEVKSTKLRSRSSK